MSATIKHNQNSLVSNDETVIIENPDPNTIRRAVKLLIHHNDVFMEPVLAIYAKYEPRIVENPDAAAIADAIKAMISESGDSIVLEKSTENYMRVCSNSKDCYDLVYQEMKFGLFNLTNQPTSQALEIALKFADGCEFKREYNWMPALLLEDEDVLDSIFHTKQYHTEFEFINTTDPSRIQGFIGFAGLADWWLKEFNAEERCHIEKEEVIWSDNYKNSGMIFHFGGDSKAHFEQIKADQEWEIVYAGDMVSRIFTSATQGQAGLCPVPAGIYLCYLAYVTMMTDRSLSLRIADKAKELLDIFAKTSHFRAKTIILDNGYTSLMATYYRSRDENVQALDKAITCAEESIKLSPEVIAKKRGKLLGHPAYKQLAIIRDKQGNYAEATRLSKEAMHQGWLGDWEKRIARYEKKLSKI